uniref:Globin domain-containing protein n=1 Tax=Knipowitschia caucasica TaxID=637954 RepID=A0AAV2LFL3_KNICA
MASTIGADALNRLFIVYPGAKTYFSHLDISPRSAQLRSHGEKIVLAIAGAAQDISQLMVTLAPLQTLHAYQLRIDPSKFKDDFTEVAHAAMDKYLSAFTAVLAEKYR